MGKRKLNQRPFAISLSEHPQTFNAIIKGKRDLNTAIALKIEKALDLEEGTLVMLQAFYEIKKEKQKNNNLRKLDISGIRKNLFWDTDISSIDWDRQYKAVIRRVFERGNFSEKRQVTQFYGVPKVRSVIGISTTRSSIKNNI
ncbi:hypothetical protein FNO01nite_17100 [Flavobacterium noncentrifugens]|uniref:DUF6922 domain-containing protein n=1 Tax=Flavobacterium noncentrifugens TaxID=1128970 RepID=A0A1G8WU91_9FLAO|nr:hypothetical protein [Flavobacterium noncentrifugens]GEP51038.1 hypothetical protein FNO01nite_17100 [Flavobacterium noncentrifugens]SDJ81160.1 hypothetical protein SAMN04487935_1935 [Flavobacterium noncentrifugens]